MAIISNYGKAIQGAGGGTDQGGNTIKQAGIMTPIIQLAGPTGETVEGRSNLQLAYNIDVYNDIRYYKPERFPILTALMSVAKPTNLSRYVISETDEDKEFFDNLFTTLRQRQATRGSEEWRGRDGYQQSASSSTTIKKPLAMTNSAFVGGKLAWTNVASGTATTDDFLKAAYAARYSAGADTALSGAAAMGTAGAATHAPVSLTKFTGKKVAAFGFATPSSGVMGAPHIVIDHHVSNLSGIGYQLTKKITDSGSVEWIGLEFVPGKSNRAELLFDNLGFSITYEGGDDPSTINNIQKHAVKIGIHQFWYNAAWDKFIMVLDLEASNLDIDWNTATGTDDGNFMLLNEAANGATLTASTLTSTGYTYFHPCMKVGAAWGVAPDGIPEGSSKRGGNQFKRTFRSKTNYTQIFRSDAWSITGTRMAERKAAFMDDWMDTRETNLFLYKDQITQAMLWGRADEFDGYNTVTGKFDRIRTTSGIWDRELNDYKVVRLSLTDYQSSFSALQASDALRRLVNEVGRSITAFTGMTKKPVVTVACSMEMIISLGELESVGKSNGPNMFGSMSMGTLPPTMKTLGVPSLRYETPQVSLIFMWDPALDYAAGFPLPYYLSSSAVSPRKIMMAIDVKNFNVRTLRPDKLQAGIQNIGDDKYEEDMIGEHGAEVINSRKNTIFIVD